MSQNITLQGASYSDVPAVELPKTGGGTATFTDVTDTTATAADVSNTKYFYTAAGVRTQGTNSGGGGLEYEEGTYTTSEDVSSADISFSNTHANVPFFVGFVDTTGDYNSTLNTAYAWWYFDWYELFGNGIYYKSTSQYYAYRNYRYRATSATSMTGSASGITSHPDTTNLTNTKFHVSFGGGYLRPNRTYKWIAVWKPTT